MKFILLSEKEKTQYSDQLFSLLLDSDKEFVPPLSSRASTTDTNLINSNGQTLLPYFNTMLKQEVLALFEGQNLVGFVSFVKGYENAEIPSISKPNIYLSTLVVSAEQRGKGITKKLYDYLFNTIYPERSIYTRTWSTNFAHIKILRGFNFALILTKPNDRGNGVDTVYFELKR